MSALPHPRFTDEEYLRREVVERYKSEFYRGEIFAMAGGSLRHNKISGNIFANLWNKLRGSPCRPHNSDQRIQVAANGLATYPDVSVVCEEAQVDPQDRQAIDNPRVIFEVLSPATESYDRGKRFHRYQELPPSRSTCSLVRKNHSSSALSAKRMATGN
jgi:Uma2 family endonuclease